MTSNKQQVLDLIEKNQIILFCKNDDEKSDEIEFYADAIDVAQNGDRDSREGFVNYVCTGMAWNFGQPNDESRIAYAVQKQAYALYLQFLKI